MTGVQTCALPICVFAGSKKLTTFDFNEKNIKLASQYLGNDFFRDCIALNNVTIPKAITHLGTTNVFKLAVAMGAPYYNDIAISANYSGAFRGCASLTSINLSGVQNIGGYAFYGCTSLTSITWPKSIMALGDYAFASCTALTTVDMTGITGYAGTKPAIFGEFCFADCTSLVTFTTPTTTSKIIYEMGDGFFARSTSLQTINFNYKAFTQFAPGANPFIGLTEYTKVAFNGTAVSAKNALNLCDESYVREYKDNIAWYNTDAALVGTDNKVIDKNGNTNTTYVPPTPPQEEKPKEEKTEK